MNEKLSKSSPVCNNYIIKQAKKYPCLWTAVLSCNRKEAGKTSGFDMI